MIIWAKWIESDGRYLYGLDDNGGVEITSQQHQQLMGAGAEGRLVRPGRKGLPEIVDPEPPTEEALQTRERSWRTAELARYEWVATRHRDEQDMGGETSLTREQYAALLKYRQELRDWPAVDAFPVIAERPSPPEWLVGLTQ